MCGCNILSNRTAGFLRDFDIKLFFQTMENNYAVAKFFFVQEIRDHTAPRPVNP